MPKKACLACLLLLAVCLPLSSCVSTAVAVTAGTIKLAGAAVSLPVKAGAAAVGAVTGDDCDEDGEACEEQDD